MATFERLYTICEQLERENAEQATSDPIPHAPPELRNAVTRQEEPINIPPGTRWKMMTVKTLQNQW